jgi:hypothetical protein
MSDSSATLSELLVIAIKIFLEKLGKEHKLPSEQKKEFFCIKIEPTYKQLCAIHEDYSKQFAKAVDLLEKGTDLEQVVQILEKDRPCYLIKRQEIIEELQALRAYRLEKKKRSEFELTFYDYVCSVDSYLSAASPLPRATWYTYFIETFSDLVANGQDPLKYDYPACSQGKDAVMLAKQQLEHAVQTGMPEAFREVQKNYAKLRAQCL